MLSLVPSAPSSCFNALMVENHEQIMVLLITRVLDRMIELPRSEKDTTFNEYILADQMGKMDHDSIPWKWGRWVKSCLQEDFGGDLLRKFSDEIPNRKPETKE